MEPINARSMINAAAAVAMDATGNRPPVERRRRLSQAALAVTNQKVRTAYSPIVIAGAVRLHRRADRRSALWLYLYSLAYLALLFAAMAVDRAVA